MKFLILIFFITTGLLLLNNCDSTDPKLEPDLKLELLDVSCTEAWLQLTTNNIQLPATVNLLKNNSVTQTFSLSTQDSLLYIDSLLPNQTYKIQVAIQQSNNTSNELSVTTMDTTSHNFTWQTFEFGQHSSSILYDVAIIDENDIWAVGEIYMNDSLGNPDPIAFNAVHWNGQSWELKRIPILLSGSPFYPIIKSIFAFNENDIWFEAGIHWDGLIFKQIQFNLQWSGNVNKLLGSSSNDLYAVGNNGNIAHYNGSSWTKIMSGTTFNLTSISGNNDEVYFSGVNSFTNEGILFKYKSSSISVLANGKIIGADEVFKPFLYGEFQSICLTGNTLFLGGNFLYQFKFNRWDYVKSLPGNFVNGNPSGSIRGFIYSINANYGNDIIISGDRNTLLHFNGNDWIQLGEPYNTGSNISHRSTKILNHIIVTVGYKGNKALIMKLVR
ncbi:MAG: glucosyl transferase [Ignavibacteriota bacterium]